jgi:transcriptional regulator with XRE-family HTH domain
VTGPSDTPAGARRRVRLAVRRAREDKKFTQSQVAEEMEWSLSKVMRIENGEVTIAPNDLRPLLGYLGIKDKETVDDLVHAAKISKQRKQWWDAPELRDGFTPSGALRQLVQLEPEATAIRYFFPLIFPARLQVPAYSRALTLAFSDELPPNVITARLAIRRKRNEGFSSRPVKPQSYVILDESVLMRQIGGREVMAEQLEEVLKLIEHQNIRVRIIPLTSDAPVPMLATYEIIYLHGEDERDAVLYRESDLLDEIVDDPDKIRRHRSLFERLWGSIHDESASIDLIRQRLTKLTGAGS